MKYRINTHNKDYLMVNKHSISLELSGLLVIEDESGLTPEKKQLKKLLINIWNNIGCYKTEKSTRTIIDEIAISRKSKLGKYLLNCSKEYKPTMITENQIIHSLFISIEDEEWKHYTVLSTIIMNYKQNKIRAIGYNDFQEQYGQELTDFIVISMSRISNIDNHNNNKNVYLYEKNKIIKTELPEQEIIKSKIKKRTIN